MVDIFEEVEEDLRAEKLRSVAVRYGGAFVAAVVVVVGVTGAWQGWQWWQTKHDAQTSDAYIRAMETAQRLPPQASADARRNAIAAFEQLAGNPSSGYGTLAGLNSAAFKAEQPDGAGAGDDWSRISSDTKASPSLRQLAILLKASHQLDQGDPDQVRSMLQSLVTIGSPWTLLAKEQLALLNLREGKNDQALAELKALTGTSLAPNGLNGRASSLVARLGG